MKVKWYFLSDDLTMVEAFKPLARITGTRVKSFFSEQELKEDLKHNKGIVLFIKESSNYDVFELCGELSISYPFISIILVLPAGKIDLKKAMYVGATDVLEENFQEKDVFEAVNKAESILEMKIEKLLPAQQGQEKPKQAEVITVCSTKGGVGKTTISVNLAASLAKKDKKVVVLDLDLQFGDVSILFDLQPKKTIYEWIKESYENDDGQIKEFLSVHESGVEVLSAPLMPEFAELVNGKHIEVILQKLKEEYDYIIVDTPPALVETGLVALENSEHILLITAMDLPTLKNGKIAIETLKLLGLNDKVRVILNRDAPIENMNISVVERILGEPVSAKIPSDYKTVVSSLNKGKPFVLNEPKSSVAKGVHNLSNDILGIEKVEKEKKSFFRSFAKK